MFSRRQTRKLRRGGGFFSAKPKAPSAANMARSEMSSVRAQAAQYKPKSRVANIMGPEFRYTDRNRKAAETAAKIKEIETKYGISEAELTEALEAASTLQKGEAMNAIKSFADSLKTKIADAGPTAAAVTLTIPIGAAQLLSKAMRVALAVFIFFFAIAHSIFFGAEIGMLGVLPNTSFETTTDTFSSLKKYFESMRGKPSGTQEWGSRRNLSE